MRHQFPYLRFKAFEGCNPRRAHIWLAGAMTMSAALLGCGGADEALESDAPASNQPAQELLKQEWVDREGDLQSVYGNQEQ